MINNLYFCNLFLFVMDYNQIYSFSDSYLKDTIIALSNDKIDKLKLFKSELNIHNPLIYTHYNGSKFYDLIYTGYSGLFLLSNKFFEILIENNISGWKKYPCTLIHRDGKKINEYSILSILGRCGSIDLTKSEKFLKQPFNPSGRPFEAKRGLYFDLNTWDKNDIFSPENSTFIFITENVMNLLKSNMFTNIEFQKITEYVII